MTDQVLMAESQYQEALLECILHKGWFGYWKRLKAVERAGIALLKAQIEASPHQDAIKCLEMLGLRITTDKEEV